VRRERSAFPRYGRKIHLPVIAATAGINQPALSSQFLLEQLASGRIVQSERETPIQRASRDLRIPPSCIRHERKV